MDKKRFYVRIGSGEILEDAGAAEYEFDIVATDEEIDKLQRLFEHAAEADIRSAASAASPFGEYQSSEESTVYDDNLRKIYEMLHDLGTPRTREHIEKMNVLPHPKTEKDPVSQG